MNRQPDEAVALLERHNIPNQELLLMLLPMTMRLSEVSMTKMSPAEASTIAGQVQMLQGRVRAFAELSIEKMCFCSKIHSFGVYESFPDNHGFRPGEIVHLYVEIQNFTSQQDGKSYIARLASTLEIVDYSGKVRWNKDFLDSSYFDVSKSPRHDYFSNYRLWIPDDLPPGSYTLRVRVKDLPTGRADERTLDFRVTTVPARSS
jgi:hypothetical protein